MRGVHDRRSDWMQRGDDGPSKFSIWALTSENGHSLGLQTALELVAPLTSNVNIKARLIPRAAVSLTVRVSLQERIEYLKVARDLLPGPSLASQLVNILGNQLISPVRFASFGPLSPTHGRVRFESYTTLSAAYSFRMRTTDQ